MTKRYFLFLVVFVLFFSMKSVYAFDSSVYQYRNICGNYEVAEVKSDGSIEKKDCFSTYEAAKSFMVQNTSDGGVIFAKVDGVTKIIDANLALLDLTVNPETLTYFYTNKELSGSAYTYMDTGSLYGGVDGVFLEAGYSNYRSTWVAKVLIGNFTGWIAASTYEIVPLCWVKSSSYYTVTNTDIRHHYVSKIQNTYTGSSGRTIGPKPDMLSAGTYYSYDGHYFYTDLSSLIRDYKAGNITHAVNSDNPYYNYYMYLSNHTKTTYSSLNIDEYIRNNLGYKENVYGNASKGGTSRLYGQGTFFYYAQEKYGVNAILSLSLSRNETGNGTSTLAINKNNGFGLNAVDSNPLQAANWYASFSSSILGYASKWITYGYAYPNDWRYFGPQFGDKWIGMNVKYASDTYWSEKMAANYYSFDKAFGLQDYNYYQLGVVKSSTIAYSSPSTSAKIIYTYPEAEDALVIVGEVVKNNQKWYKVVSDVNLDQNYNEITSGDYNWNSYVYVLASQVQKINVGKNGYVDSSSVFEYDDAQYEYDLYIENTELKPKVAISLKETPYYYDSSLSSQTGKNLKKDRYVMVYTAVYQGGSPVAYLVTSDYWHDQKEWVSADSIRFTTMSYGRVSVTASGNQYTWVNYNTKDESSSLISGLYTNSYVPILDKVTVSGVVWYKVPVNLVGDDNIFGYTLASAPSVSIIVSQFSAKDNSPVIYAKDQTMFVGDTWNPKKDVSATDAEDGDLTSKISVSSDNVNSKVAGEYQVVYKVVDSAKNTTTKTIKVIVKENQAPVITAQDKKISLGQAFDAKKNVTATDVEDGNLTSKIKVTVNTVNSAVEGEYRVVYEVSDSRGKKTTKEIKVQVIEVKDLDYQNLDLSKLEEKEAIFYFDYLKVVENKLQIKGYHTIRGMDNTLASNITYVLQFQSLTTDDSYTQVIDRVTNKDEITRPINSKDSYDYTYSWFKGNIDLANLPDGDYQVFILTIYENIYYAKSVVNNKVLRTQVASFEGEKFVTTRCNYFDKDLALELIVRSQKIASKTADSTYNMYNQYRTLEFKNEKLHIKGTSYSYGMNLSSLTKVERKLILENTSTYEKYSFDLGSITDGLYKAGTTLKDNFDKDRAWFDASINLSSLPKGNYAIYLSTSSNIQDYGELNEILGRDVSKITATIKGKKYSFEIDSVNRYRIELNVE